MLLVYLWIYYFSAQSIGTFSTKFVGNQILGMTLVKPAYEKKECKMSYFFPLRMRLFYGNRIMLWGYGSISGSNSYMCLQNGQKLEIWSNRIFSFTFILEHLFSPIVKPQCLPSMRYMMWRAFWQPLLTALLVFLQ